MRESASVKDSLGRFLIENRNAKKAVIINSRCDLDLLAGILKEASGAGAAFDTVLFKSEVPPEFDRMPGKVSVSDDYLSASDCERIDSHVFEDISKNWDADAAAKRKDIFEYRGIMLARLMEYDFELFLLPRVKALKIFDNIMKREMYEAVCIIDANDELEGYDLLIEGLYGIPAALKRAGSAKHPAGILKRRAAEALSCLLDAVARLPVYGKTSGVLMDARLYFQIEPRGRHEILPAPLEKGLCVRLKAVRSTGVYFALMISPSARGKLFFGNRRGLFNTEELRSRFVFEGLSYWPLVRKRVDALIREDFSRLRRNIDLFGALSEKRRIKSVVLRNDVKEAEKTIVFSARRRGIPTLVVQHGALAEHNGHKRIFADKIAVWGEYGVRWYEKFGNDKNRLMIAGRTGHEKLVQKKNSLPDNDILRRSGIGKREGRYFVTLVSPGQSMQRQTSFLSDDVTEVIVRNILREAALLKNVDVIIKAHPQEDLKALEKLISPTDACFAKAVQDVDIYELIKLSDVVITMDSTVGLDALIMDKPLMVVNFTRRKDLIPYVAGGVAMGVYKKNELSGTLRKMLEGRLLAEGASPARKSFLEDFIRDSNVSASETIMSTIGSLK